jgi:AraC-like DNA-binding protein
MLVSAWSSTTASSPSRSSLFTGAHVQLDEARWSPAFERQVSSWVAQATTLVVMDDGSAVVSVADSTPRSAYHETRRATAFAEIANRIRPTELCAAFRFDANAVASSLSAMPNDAPQFLADNPGPDAGLIQLSPQALFRYYWRRIALILRYPAPEEHVESDAKSLLRHVVSRATAQRPVVDTNSSTVRARHRRLAREARILMAEAIADPNPIAQIAGALGTSPFHLARVFRAEVGSSPHQYLVQLRLIAALTQLRAGAPDQSKLALELGFCHHSHFTAVFRQVLGYTPREVRRMLTADTIADLAIAARQCS